MSFDSGHPEPLGYQIRTKKKKKKVCVWGPGTGTGTGKSLQSCPTLCNPIDNSLPGSPVPGILQARILEWVAISSSNAWKWKVKVKSLSHVRLSQWSHGLQPTRLLRPWDFPGKSTGMGCHRLLQFEVQMWWNWCYQALGGHLDVGLYIQLKNWLLDIIWASRGRRIRLKRKLFRENSWTFQILSFFLSLSLPPFLSFKNISIFDCTGLSCGT